MAFIHCVSSQLQSKPSVNSYNSDSFLKLFGTTRSKYNTHINITRALARTHRIKNMMKPPFNTLIPYLNMSFLTDCLNFKVGMWVFSQGLRLRSGISVQSAWEISFGEHYLLHSGGNRHVCALVYDDRCADFETKLKSCDEWYCIIVVALKENSPVFGVVGKQSRYDY